MDVLAMIGWVRLALKHLAPTEIGVLNQEQDETKCRGACVAA